MVKKNSSFSAFESLSPPLTFVRLWQAIGWLMVVAVVVVTLLPKPPKPPVITWDKAQHLLTYGILMLWFAQAFTNRWLWLGFLAGLGVALEYLQGWFGYRQFDYIDMLANSLGVLAGLLLASTPLGHLIPWLDRRLSGLWLRN